MSVIPVELQEHPCFNSQFQGLYGRIHLPVAKNCNISCNYCDRRYHCVNQSRPGVTRKIMTPEEALEYLSLNDTEENKLKVVGIAGPGEPLFNEETFTTLKFVKENYPEKLLCLSTNGFLLPEKIEQLYQLGIDALTITLNTLKLDTAKKIYSMPESFLEKFLEKQKEGVEATVSKKIPLKLNMVFIPGINDNEVEEIAKFGKKSKATIMNIMPLIPQAKFRNLQAPNKKHIKDIKEKTAAILHQQAHCGQCRADAVGLICKD